MVATSLVFIVIVIVVVVSTITEAILFHGGEGRASRDAFAAASDDDPRLRGDRLAGGERSCGYPLSCRSASQARPVLRHCEQSEAIF